MVEAFSDSVTLISGTPFISNGNFQISAEHMLTKLRMHAFSATRQIIAFQWLLCCARPP